MALSTSIGSSSRTAATASLHGSRPSSYERDPYNRLLARGPRFRVEGEIVRDIALAASGLLNPRNWRAGRYAARARTSSSSRPTSYAPFPWNDEIGNEKYRRALYTFRRRSTPYPVLQTFDVPNADFSCVRRRSNSPLQALISLNEPIFVECAQALARQAVAEGGRTDAARVTYAFRRALARQPTSDEKHELLTLLRQRRERIADGWVNATNVATGKSDSPVQVPAGTSPAQWAAYTVVARVLLNLDETITKE